tara:strand:- start:2134 stop:3783 length:1650 start_codon:yes stop_codon:yes gene_type:complete
MIFTNDKVETEENMIKYMSRILKRSTLMFMILTMSGCLDFDVENLNAPDEARALATPSDVESLIKGSFLQYYEAIENGTPNMTMATMSDAFTCSWGNYGMGLLSSEPRVEYVNNTSQGYAGASQYPWFGLYGAISSAADGVRNVESGAVNLGPNSKRALAFGKFVQGVALGWQALYFDQGFPLDEDVDLATDVLELAPYTEVMDFAIANLAEAASIADANSFTIPADWMNGKTYSNAELSQVAHSHIARFMAAVSRTIAERKAVDWNAVLTHLSKGITEDFSITGNGGGRSDPWWNSAQWYSAENNTWQRADYMLLGPSDESTGFSDWLAKNVNDRTEFLMQSGDKRIWSGEYSDDGDEIPGLLYEQLGPSVFPLSRGTYHASRYGLYRWDEYRYVTSTGSPAPMLMLAEHDYLTMEAYLHLGRESEVPAILDKYRTDRGGYPTSEGEAVGDIDDDPSPKPGSGLWAMVKYDKMLELASSYPGLEYFEKRGWHDLAGLTLLHFPVPALDLETLQLPLYSHGGGVGDSAPPRATAGYNRAFEPDDLKLRR